MKDKIILVDEHDNKIGEAEKLAAHQQGLCHRAFSVFIFHKENNEWKLLLQKRHPDKYHSGGLWTNTCCSHPRPTETITQAAQRRLQEEMGLQLELTTVGEFHYRTEFDNGLIENEYDHVLIGIMNSPSTVHFNKNEVIDTCWMTAPELLQELATQPKKFTSWFKQALEIAIKCLPH